MPLVQQPRESIGKELGQRGHLLEWGTTLRRSVDQELKPLPEQSGMLLMDGRVEVLRLLADWIKIHPIHPIAGDTRPPRHFVSFEQLDRTGDGAPARQQCFAQLIDRLLGRVTDEEIPQQAASHRRKTVLTCIKATEVISEDQVGVL